MRVLLIYPPTENMIRTSVLSLVDEEVGIYPPLGLMYVASYAEANTDHEIEILDTQAEGMSYDDIRAEIERRKPEIVGIQAMTFSIIDGLKTAQIVKEINKDIHVCMGGPHPTLYPQETIKRAEIDSVVMGEGEITFTSLLSVLDKGRMDTPIEGLIFKNGDGEIIDGGRRDFLKDIDILPYPARHLTPYEKYNSLLAKRSPITTMITSRGCPYRCIYCDRPQMGKRFRARSAQNVVREIEECIDMGIYEFFVYDDTFTVSRRRAIAICDEIISRGLKIGWDIRARANTVDDLLLRKLKKAGCERIQYGIEAGTQDTLDILQKDITLEQARSAVRMTKEVGIDILLDFMIGSPGETRDHIMKTIDFAEELSPNYVQFSVTTPYPATKLYYMGLEEGILPNDYWKEFAENPRNDFTPLLWEEKLSEKELLELLKYAYKRFYIRPSYIIKNVMSIRSLGEFKRKAKAGLRLLVS